MLDTCCTVECQKRRRKEDKDLPFYCIPSSSTAAGNTERKSYLFIPKQTSTKSPTIS